MSKYVQKETVKQATGEEKTIYVVKDVVCKKRLVFSFLKRFADIFLSFLGGIILLPVMLILGIMVRLDSPGKAIYSQVRLGKNGKEFKLLKFRTMRIDAEANGPVWAGKDDERCTKLGAKLRKYRFDELPQLYNIFVGHMSIVGPRPERPCFYEEFKGYIDGFDKRLAVKPGLTGLAQVNGGYDLKPEEKVVFDMQYIEERSIWMDIKIIFKTVKLVFTHEGAR